MNNIFKKCKGKKGFTLVELIITVAILTVVMGIIMGALSPIFFNYHKDTEYITAMDMAKTAAKYVSTIVKKGNFIGLSGDNEKVFDNDKGTPIQIDNAFFTENGKLYRRDKDHGGAAQSVYADSYWQEYTIDMSFIAHKKDIAVTVVEIKITMTSVATGNVVATHSECFNAVNIELKHKEIEVMGTNEDAEFSYLLFNLPTPEGVKDNI